MPHAQQDPVQQQPTAGSTSAAISNDVVRIAHRYTGRGPTKARTTIDRGFVAVVMGDTLLPAERTLAESGEGALVLEVRRKFQDAMRGELVAAVEQHTGRKVAAFMSTNHIDPDMAVEMFVLEAA
jgi:uncharacterized protein YbcI